MGQGFYERPFADVAVIKAERLALSAPSYLPPNLSPFMVKACSFVVVNSGT